MNALGITRQLSVIMFSDIVDYTAMMQDNEINTMVTRDKYRQAIKHLTEKFGGKVLQHYGDGTLTTFSSSVSAVQCALQLQQEMKQDPDVSDQNWDTFGRCCF